MGVFTNYSGSSNFYIADNYFIGRDDPNHVIGWSGNFWAPFNGVDGQKFPPVMASYMAVKVYGPGHVVAYNYVANFHDGIDIETYGNPDGSAAVDGPKYPPREFWDRRPVSIDFYNNYMTNFHDNPFEIDGSMHNIRVMRNMMINSASHAFCNQPALGGPVYWIRNIAYHLPGGSTRLTSGSAGVLFYNNTILSETAAQARVERALAQQSDPRRELGAGDLQRQHVHQLHLVGLQRLPPESRRADVVPVELAAAGRAPPDFSATRRRRRRRDASCSRASSRRSRSTARRPGQDQHSVLVDYDVFVNVPKLDAQDRATVQKVYKAEDFDFRLKPDSAAVDQGIALPNVTDGFTGRAPDLGALEARSAAAALRPPTDGASVTSCRRTCRRRSVKPHRRASRSLTIRDARSRLA